MSITDTKARDLRHPFSVNIIGLDNFTKALSDPTFRKAAGNTAYFVLVGMPLTLVVALAAAVALDKGITRFRAVFRLGFYMPVITSIVAVAVVWRFLLQDPGGLINTALGWVGITGPNWLGDPHWSMPSLILMASWRNFGTAMIIFLAGLQAVPPSSTRRPPSTARTPGSGSASSRCRCCARPCSSSWSRPPSATCSSSRSRSS